MYVWASSDLYLIGKDAITATFTLVGILIAALGLITWKKQIKGSKEFESAYNLNLALLRVREAIKHVRNPAVWPSESYRAKKYAKEKYPERSDEQIQKEEHSSVYEMRWEKITTAYIEAESHLLSAEVLWGKEIANLVQPLNKKVRELNINLNQYFNEDLRTKDPMAIHDVVYDQGNETTEDRFASEITSIIDGVADYLKKKIK